MNKDLLIKGMIFLAGGAIGSVVTWKLVKTKYEQIANEEIESMREYYNKKKGIKEVGEKIEEGIEKSDEVTVRQIRDKVQELGYINEQVMKEKEDKKEDDDDVEKPCIIAPEESWEQDYPIITLTYYEGDGVLADENNKEISNIEELVPEDFADHFGEYEDDSVFVRNDAFKIYYEILRDLGSFSEN